MKILVVLAIWALAGAANAAEFCTGQESSIAPDMQVQEADLTREAAVEAAERLAERIREDALQGESELGVLNAKKIIEGYLLRRQAEHLASELGPSAPGAEEARAVFCSWLTSDGFWYD
jgi:hypothetical protein